MKAILDGSAKTYVGSGFMNDGQLSILLAVPAVDEAGRTVGVVMGTLSLERVARHLTGFGFGGNDLIVLDRADQLVISGAGRGDLDVASNPQLVDRLRHGAPTSAVGVTDPLDRPDRLLTAAQSPTGDWLILVSRSTGAAFGADRRNLQIELAGLAFATVCAIGLAWFGARRLDTLQLVADEAARAEQLVRERSSRMRLAITEMGTAHLSPNLPEDAGPLLPARRIGCADPATPL